MPAAKPKGYKVVGAAAVIRKDKHERYVYRGAVFSPDVIDEANAKHLLAAGLIEKYEPPKADQAEGGSTDQAEGGSEK